VLVLLVAFVEDLQQFSLAYFGRIIVATTLSFALRSFHVGNTLQSERLFASTAVMVYATGCVDTSTHSMFSKW
jgi:hypothetical protein